LAGHVLLVGGFPFRDDHSAWLVACDDLCEGGGGLIQAAGTRGWHAQPMGVE
jgi:hypothetical protein